MTTPDAFARFFLDYLDRTEQVVLRFDPEGRIGPMNARLERLVARADGVPWAGRPAEDLVDSPGAAALREFLAAAGSLGVDLTLRGASGLLRFTGALGRVEGGWSLFLGREALASERKVLEELSRTNMQLANLSRELDRRNRELEEARDRIKEMGGLVPICAGCKKIRNDEGFWDHVERFIMAHADVRFSHGICPECSKSLYGIDLAGGRL